MTDAVVVDSAMLDEDDVNDETDVETEDKVFGCLEEEEYMVDVRNL
jgi:hypothetical protein